MDIVCARVGSLAYARIAVAGHGSLQEWKETVKPMLAGIDRCKRRCCKAGSMTILEVIDCKLVISGWGLNKDVAMAISAHAHSCTSLYLYKRNTASSKPNG